MVPVGKRQHTVPRAYLRGFTDQKERLRAFDRVKQQALTATLTNAAVVKDIYAMPAASGLDHQLIETWLAEKESAAAGPLAGIRSGRAVVDQASRDALTGFIAVQLTRTTRVWHQMHELGDWYGKVWFRGIIREGVRERLRKVGREPTDEEIEQVLDFANNLDKYTLVPPDGSFLHWFLTSFLRILPFLTSGWTWVVFRSRRPFLTSDHPVVMVGDSTDGGLRIANAQEIWLPVGRHHAIVLTKDQSLPAVLLDVPPVHIKRLCQRIALESDRWLFWHPKDDALDGLTTPPPGPALRIESVGWRDRGNGTVGELVRFGPNLPVISGECLLGGRPVANYRGMPAPSWRPGHLPSAPPGLQ